MWAIYNRPPDHPFAFVARRFNFSPTGTDVLATDNIIIAAQIETLRELMRERGLTCAPPEPSDDPRIVEVWL